MSAAAVTARPSQALRQRRESQRPGLTRASTTKASNMENGSAKEDPKRYVYKQQDILAKFNGKPPSLRVYLHANHFRLNDSQESLPYHSPMRELLQHIRLKTVPHNMLSDFYESGVPFYDNCLIVEVHDSRSGSIKPKEDSSNTPNGNSTKPFSIHNYNNFITPSPHVAYPNKTPAKANQVDGQNKGTLGVDSAKENKDANKENMPAPGQPASQKQPTKERVYTVVLFPTPQSHMVDLQLLATTPVPDLQTYRKMQAQGKAVGNPPTPLTAVPPTPTLPTGRSPKRQKMVIDETNAHEFESVVLDAICPKLYLEPTKTLEESTALIQAMTHPNNQNSPPTRKTRKRTTAELAADEAEAADLQRFMLAGDEFQAVKTAAATGGDEAQPAVRAGANFQTFSRFKTLAHIKVQHEEREREKREEEARQAQLKRQAQAEAEAQKRRELEASRHAEQNQAMMQQRQEQMLRQQQQQAALQQEQAMRAASQAQQMANAPAAQATPQSATQPQFSSPVGRQNTPMVSSPMVAAHSSHPMGGTPMAATASNHGAGSPPRPPSAVSHHPVNMARTASQQHNLLSRTGTPQVPQGTPVMGTAMPARNVSATPQPRLNQGSPTVPIQGGTPIMMQTSHNASGMTPEQIQMARNMQNRMRAQAMGQNAQMSPNNMSANQMAVMKARAHVAREGIPQGQNQQAYMQMLAQRYLQEITQQQQQQHMAANMSPQNAQMRPDGMPHAGMPNQASMSVANMNANQLKMQYQSRKTQLLQNFGTLQNIPPNHMQQMRQLEMAIQARERQEQQAAQASGQMQMNQAIQGQMNMGGQTPQNPMQMQQYQAALQQQRAQQQRAQQLRMMQQQGMGGGQMQQNMMNNMNMQNINVGNMGNMGGMQGMNMANMGNMGGMQGMGNMGGMQNMQQMQQQQMMRMMQAQAQMRAGQQRPGGGDGSGMDWSGV
ncbi:hypothetical protein CC78DRAFT_567762 [Lojkania enalia]|uniref:Spt20-like SEP domain-containing protein n=1 Tax=Lojkania enalia TaxID=147567 RepID=A0A9P4N0Q4_9PLEO|nr:hypothetical protein CC78DRAFT_567762 [Didymosphaeria enalia]